MTSKTKVRRVPKFMKICLNCARPSESTGYGCGLCNEKWQKEYRALDLEMMLNSRTKHRLQESFADFDFQDSTGILQYGGLPVEQQIPGFEIPVGLTPLLFFKNLSNTFGCNVFGKAEGLNPSGCFKDRETLLCLLNSYQQNFKKAVIYSSGNAAASASIFAQKSDFRLITFVAGDTYPEKIEYIIDHGSDVVVIGDENTNFERGYRIYAGINAMGFFRENGYDDWSVRNPYRAQGDKTIALEIIKQMRGKVPDYVVVPTANGTCLAGIWKGFKEFYELGVIDRLPKMISAGIKSASPVAAAVTQNEVTRPLKCDLSKVTPDDAKIGSIIMAEEGYDSVQAARAVIESAGMALEVGSKDLEKTLTQFLQEEGEVASEYNLVPEPASLISIAAISQLKELKGLDESSTVVSVITGSGVKAREQISDLLESESLQKKASDLLNKRAQEQFPKAKNRGSVYYVDEDFESVGNVFYQISKSIDND